jgi:hypothetical protein
MAATSQFYLRSGRIYEFRLNEEAKHGVAFIYRVEEFIVYHKAQKLKPEREIPFRKTGLA